jgi:hypothetical protein
VDEKRSKGTRPRGAELAARYDPPLPRHRRQAAALLILLGLPLLAGGLLDDGTGHQVARGFGTTFLAVALLEVLPELARWRIERGDRRLFIDFFGEHALSHCIHIVNAGRVVSDEGLPLLIPEPCPRDVKDMNRIPEGVEYWMAGDDIRASSYLSQRLAVQGVEVKMETAGANYEEFLNQWSSISLGLGFNIHTRRLADMSRIFDVDWSSVPTGEGMADGAFTTDHFVLLHDGDERPQKPEDPDAEDLALIVRYVPKDDDGCVHFVAAGRTALGTGVAGHFLATRWKEIAARYEGQGFTRSIAVVIRHDVFIDRHDADGTGEIIEAIGPVDVTGRASTLT